MFIGNIHCPLEYSLAKSQMEHRLIGTPNLSLNRVDFRSQYDLHHWLQVLDQTVLPYL